MENLNVNQIITQLKIKLESKNLKTIEDLKNKVNKEKENTIIEQLKTERIYEKRLEELERACKYWERRYLELERKQRLEYVN